MITVFCVLTARAATSLTQGVGHSQGMAQHASLPCHRRVDRLLQAFHWACDRNEPDVAGAVLALLVAYANQYPRLPTGVERRARVTLLGPYERLQNLFLYAGQVRWNDLPQGPHPPA